MTAPAFFPHPPGTWERRTDKLADLHDLGPEQSTEGGQSRYPLWVNKHHDPKEQKFVKS